MTKAAERKVHRAQRKREVQALHDFLIDLIEPRGGHVMKHNVGQKRVSVFKWGSHTWRMTIEPDGDDV